MGYIEEVRELVGDRPLIMVGATLLLVDEHDRLLMLYRTDNKCWGVPGGSMEPGESLEDTARRETKEETGLEIGEMTLYGMFSGPEFFYQYPNGDQVYIVTAVFITRDFHGALQLNSEEHTAWQFVDVNHLPEEISPPVRPILKSYFDGRRRDHVRPSGYINAGSGALI